MSEKLFKHRCEIPQAGKKSGKRKLQREKEDLFPSCPPILSENEKLGDYYLQFSYLLQSTTWLIE